MFGAILCYLDLYGTNKKQFDIMGYHRGIVGYISYFFRSRNWNWDWFTLGISMCTGSDKSVTTWSICSTTELVHLLNDSFGTAERICPSSQ